MNSFLKSKHDFSIWNWFLNFVIRYDFTAKGTTSLELQVLPIACIYFGKRSHFKEKINNDPKYKITFGNSYFLGLFLLTIASLVASTIYLIIPDPTGIIFNNPKFMRTLDVLVSSLVIGVVVDAVISAYLTYRQF